jgi:methyl-accepting chemotaxis protein
MKSIFNLQRAAIVLIIILVIIAIVNVIISLRTTSALMTYANQVAVLDEAEKNGANLQFQTAQIQQFLTDVAATGNRDAFAEAETQLQKANKSLDNLSELMPESKPSFDALRADLMAFNTIGIEMAETYLAKGQAAGNEIMKMPEAGFDARAAKLISNTESFITLLFSNNTALKKEWADKRAQMRTILVLQNIFSILAFIIVLIYIGRKLFKSLGGEPVLAQQIASAIANGDLSADIPIKSGDNTSLVAKLNHMQSNLRSLISQIQISAESINNGTHEISAGNTTLSQRTEEQASSLEETASSMEQMAATVKQNAENAKQANVMSNEASEVALKGRRSVAQVIFTMEEISASSKKIVDIISVIDGIAFQTNILALNAAVEAARAGEQGRGFAVVAAEVRSLAQRSATAAKEIKQLINASVENVASGSKLVEDTADTMADIVTAVKQVTDIVNEIAAASQEQSAGIDQVNNAITNMDEVTQQNAALVEQAAAAAMALQQRAQELTDATSQFKLNAGADYRAIHEPTKEPTEQRPDLNTMDALTTNELPNNKTKSRRLKAPKAKPNEDWEEF